MVVDFHIYVHLCHHLKVNPNYLTFFSRGGKGGMDNMLYGTETPDAAR